jgi:DNA (cytosine-5)-methyltransferase 1
MQVIDLFSGIGGFSLAASWMGWRTVQFCEIDKYCQLLLKQNFPGVPIHHDIKTLRGNNIEINSDEPSILVGGFPCFTKGTIVKTLNGYIPISELVVGDMVLTHTGAYMPIEYLMKKDGADILCIKPQGLHKFIETTNEHPFFVKKSKHSKEEWVNACDIKKGNFIGYRLSEGYLDSYTPEFWYLVGRYLGDGWILNGKRASKIPQGKRGSKVNSFNWKVVICTSKEDKDSLHSKILSAGFNPTVSECRTTFKFIICSKELVEFLLPFGRYAHGKTLLGYCSLLTLDRQKALFDGWRDADGYIDKHGAMKCTTISEALVYSMAEIARNAYKRPVSITEKKPNRVCIIEGRAVKERSSFCLTVSNSNRYGFYENGHLWCLVKQIKNINEKETVYNIAVKGDNSYTVYGISVHNCQPFSNAGKRKGKEDDRHLFPEMLRIIREVRPKYVVGENVAGIVSWDGGLVFEEVQSDLEAEGYEVQAFILPAVSVGAPHRRDRVWFVAHANNHRERQTRSGFENEKFKLATLQKNEQRSKLQTIFDSRLLSLQRNSEIRYCNAPNSNSRGLERSSTFQWASEYVKWKSRLLGKKQNAKNPNVQRCPQFNISSFNAKQGHDGKFNNAELPNWDKFPTQSPVCGRNDGISNRVDRIKALGNAIVPQVAYQIFKAIQDFENYVETN